MEPEVKFKKYGLRQNISWSLKLNWGFSKRFTLLRFLASIQEFGFSLLNGFIIGFVIDALISYTDNPQDTNTIVIGMLAFAVYYIANAIFSALTNYNDGVSWLKLFYELPETLRANKIKGVSMETLESPDFQNLHRRYAEDNYNMNDFARKLFMLTGIGLSLALAFIPLVNVIPLVTVLLVIATLPAYFIARYIGRVLWKLDMDLVVSSRQDDAVRGWFSDPHFIKEIKMLNGFDYLFGYFQNYIRKKYVPLSKAYSLWGWMDLGAALLRVSVIIIGIYNLIHLAADNVISVGQIAFYLTALTTLSYLIDQFASHLSGFLSLNDRVSELRAFLEYNEDKRNAPITLPLLTQPPLIQINNLNFHYPNAEKLVLKNINLQIKPGEKIAIVGENGAGKTTLIKLLSNIYQTPQGEILINGQNLDQIDQMSWFQNLGVLYQDYNTYDDLSVFENIALGNITQAIDYPKLQDAARKADAEAFIMDYENNYSQILSERYDGGIRPSTGQWQKIAIARFFYRNAPILILDEPTSSIDAVAEAAIFERIYEFTQNKTVIIVSHRFSTVRNADRILVMNQAQIVEDGSHEELMQLNGKYANAFRLQAKGYN